MGRNYEMNWNGFTGTIKSKNAVAEVKMRPDNEGWECRVIAGEFAIVDFKESFKVMPFERQFESGELGAAHDWCVKQISDYERNHKQSV